MSYHRRKVKGTLHWVSARHGVKAEVSQFERQGYFYADPVSCVDGKLIFNRTVGLRDTWNKVQGGK